MKTPVILAALVIASGCAQTTEIPTASEVPLPPAQALDVASAPNADATCAHGTVSEDRNFILCENGALRKAEVEKALDSDVDTDLTIETVARKYDIASQVFTGIDLTTYGTLVRRDRRPAPTVTTRKATEYETVRVRGKLYDVYHVGIGEKSGTIFVERKDQ